VLFELVDRGLSEEPIGTDPDHTRRATAPLPAWLDADRGRPPTMVAFDDTSAELSETVSAIQSFHGLEDGLPSIYRTLAQWPGFVGPMWNDIEPVLQSDGFSTAVDDARTAVNEYVDSLPYTPQLNPDSLERQGIDGAAIDELQGLFREFNQGAIETVVPALPVYATTVDAVGSRSLE